MVCSDGLRVIMHSKRSFDGCEPGPSPRQKTPIKLGFAQAIAEVELHRNSGLKLQRLDGCPLADQAGRIREAQTS